MEFIITIIAFLVIFSFLVLVHEWGHFFAAKKSGVKVEEFGMGMPPKAKTLFKRGDTEYTLNWIPFGGFVRMLGQSDFDPESDSTADHDPRSFRNKAFWQKAIIISAGVIMNFLAAFVLLCIVLAVGFKPLFILPAHLVDIDIPSVITPIDTHVFEGVPAVIESTSADSRAEQAGLQGGDIIVAINGEEMSDPITTLRIMQMLQGEAMTMTIERPNNNSPPETISVSFPEEKGAPYGVIFTQLPDVPTTQVPLLEVPGAAFQELGNQMVITLTLAKRLFGGILTKGEVSEDIAGPVGIVQITGVVASKGIMALVLLTIILSINLGIMNILPIPALDGGHLLTISITTVYEKITKKKPNPKIEATIHGIGFMLLMALIFIVTWKDITRLLGSF